MRLIDADKLKEAECADCVFRIDTDLLACRKDCPVMLRIDCIPTEEEKAEMDEEVTE